LAQTAGDDTLWEVILVDNCSNDGTADVVKTLWNSNIPLNIIQEPEQGLQYARVAGISQAKYEYLSFIDDDNRIAANWVQKVAELFTADDGAAMFGGKSDAVFETDPPAWFAGIQGSFAVGSQAIREGDITDTRGYLWGAGLSFRKSVYESIVRQGFRSLLTDRSGAGLNSGGDKELCLAFGLAGYRIWYSEELQFGHYIPSRRLTWDYAVRLFKGLGEPEFIFEIYRMVKNGAKFPFIRLYSRLIPYCLVYFGWRVFHPAGRQEGNIRYLSYLARKEYIINMLKNIFTFRCMYRKISRLNPTDG
jgi:glycosyltransferase involved in cell wall biosynthesis